MWRVLGSNHDSWHSRCHASLVQIDVLHFLFVKELFEHVYPVSLQVCHERLVVLIVRLLDFPLVLVDHGPLMSSVKPEECLRVMIRHLLNVDVWFGSVCGKSQHASSALRTISFPQLCLRRETDIFLIQMIVLLFIEIIAKLDLGEVFFN